MITWIETRERSAIADDISLWPEWMAPSRPAPPSLRIFFEKGIGKIYLTPKDYEERGDEIKHLFPEAVYVEPREPEDLPKNTR
jgi:hypothetical protein